MRSFHGHGAHLRALLLMAAVASGVFAQTSSITGNITDPTGSVIPGASITITNSDTGAERLTTGDAQGRYTIQQVPPGFYNVTAKAPGFADAVVNRVELLVNQPATLDLKFTKVGSTLQTVEVAASAVQVNTTDASLGNAINTNAITQMPDVLRPQCCGPACISAGRHQL